MSELQVIAQRRSEAAMALHMSAMPKDVKALQQQLAAKGLLKSGNMLRGVLAIAQNALTAQAATLAEHYTWAITESLVATSSWVTTLSRQASDSLQPLFDLGAQQIVAACALAQQPQLADRLLNDLRTTQDQVRNNIELALRASYASKSRGVLRQLFGGLKRLVPK
jgi:hypothetical protein